MINNDVTFFSPKKGYEVSRALQSHDRTYEQRTRSFLRFSLVSAVVSAIMQLSLSTGRERESSRSKQS